jgi:hypothetical protein
VGVVDTSKWSQSQSTSPNGSISNIMQNGSIGVGGLVPNGFNQGTMNKMQLNGVNSPSVSQQSNPDWQLNSNIFTNRVYFKINYILLCMCFIAKCCFLIASLLSCLSINVLFNQLVYSY